MKLELKPLSEQVVVVYGASSGIGRVTALEAVRRGARVIGAGRDEQALTSLREEADTIRSGRLETGVGDVADFSRVAHIADLAIARFGRIDTWAHVAGVGQWGRVQEMLPEEYKRVIEVDLLGPIWGALASLQHLRRDGGAYIVVSSEEARRGFALMSSYSAAKHGVHGFVESMRIELEHDHVPVSVTEIMPGTIRTPFFENARSVLGVRGSGPPPAYSPEKVAEAILDAAEHPKREVVVGGAAKLQLAMQKVSPRLVDVMSRSKAAWRAERSEEPRRPTDDALFTPPAGEDRERGDVTTMHR
jgi:NAD(P)-dependent dehydrogenase (short-subunit alcohol dehydrogenase family)